MSVDSTKSISSASKDSDDPKACYPNVKSTRKYNLANNTLKVILRDYKNIGYIPFFNDVVEKTESDVAELKNTIKYNNDNRDKCVKGTINQDKGTCIIMKKVTVGKKYKIDDKYKGKYETSDGIHFTETAAKTALEIYFNYVPGL